MSTPESLEIAAVVDRFPQDTRQRMLSALLRLADIYRASGESDVPLAELRRQYREAHLEELAPTNDNVISLADRRGRG